MRGFSFTGMTVAVILGLFAPNAVARAQEEPLIPGLSPEEEEIVIFVLGNTAFTLYHELGHALISELDLPVIGREEDAVDGFAAVMMISEEPDDMADALISAAADGWALLADALAEQGAEIAFWARHGLDEQRYYQAICHLVGADPEGFEEFAVESGLPEERVETCPFDYAQMFDGWQRLLAPHATANGIPAYGSIRVVYEPTGGDFAELQEGLRESGVTEAIAQEIADGVRLPRDLTIRYAGCDGDSNAYWDSEAGEVIMCHELIAEFRDLIVADIDRAR